jgi:hypothetical protein
MIFFDTREDMEWLREEHIPDLDIEKYHSAIVEGNEDYPVRVDVYESPQPTINDIPVSYKYSLTIDNTMVRLRI